MSESDAAQPERRLARIGRPSKVEQVLTQATIDEIADLLIEGHYQETVAAALGIHRWTWWNWMQRGEREPGTLFEVFSNTVKMAMARAEILLVRQIRMGEEGWQSKAWISERRFQERWGRRLDITIRREAEALAVQAGCTVEELLADAERIVQKAEAGIRVD